MVDTSRIEELRRRVRADPASVAFAALAEEYRRAGRHREAVEVCRAGLAHHRVYLSARVTLGRALIELGELDEAEVELEKVLKVAPSSLPALRALADIQHRRGRLHEALELYKQAVDVAQQGGHTLGPFEAGHPPDLAPEPAPAEPPPAHPIARVATDPDLRVMPNAPPEPVVADAGRRTAEIDPARKRLLERLERWLDAVDRRRRPAH
jgi:tetratricopeptide (TPR) repeat protein